MYGSYLASSNEAQLFAPADVAVDAAPRLSLVVGRADMKLWLSMSTIIVVLMSCWACESKADSSDTHASLVARLTDPSKPWERSRASDEMHKLSMEEQRQLVPALVDKLSAWNNYVRQNAAETLGELDEAADEAIPFLKKRAASDPNKDVALIAMVSLARMGIDTSQTLGVLIDRLGNRSGGHEGMPNRYLAANYIGFIASGSRHLDVTAAIPALVLALQDSDQAVRGRAAWALGSAGKQAEKAVEALKESAWNDPSRNVRSTASWALKQVGTPAANQALKGWVLTDK